MDLSLVRGKIRLLRPMPYSRQLRLWWNGSAIPCVLWPWLLPGESRKQFNALCDKVQLIGTLRADDDELLLDMVDKLKKLARRTAEQFDCSSELKLLPDEGTC